VRTAMELKNAAAVCLISFFSATMVVLIARWLDGRAAGRLEPQLSSIAEELRAIRKQGAVAVSPGEPFVGEAFNDELIVYSFHGNARCPTCRSIESHAHEVVKSHFADELKRGKVAWRVLNYEKPGVAKLRKKFDVQIPVVVLARMKDGQVEKWERLDRVWALANDQPVFAEYVRERIGSMLDTPARPNIPIPEETVLPNIEGNTGHETR